MIECKKMNKFECSPEVYLLLTVVRRYLRNSSVMSELDVRKPLQLIGTHIRAKSSDSVILPLIYDFFNRGFCWSHHAPKFNSTYFMSHSVVIHALCLIEVIKIGNEKLYREIKMSLENYTNYEYHFNGRSDTEKIKLCQPCFELSKMLQGINDVNVAKHLLEI